MNNFLLLGDSHLVSVLDAARALAPGGMREHEGGPFSVHELALPGSRLVFVMPAAGAPPLVHKYDSEGFAMSAEYAAVLRQALALLGPGKLTVCSYFFGNEHSAFSIAEHPVPFDVLLGPDDAPCPGDAPRQIVPLSVIERKMADLSWRPEVYCRVLKLALAGPRIVHILPPPPIADEAQVRGDPEIFGQLFARYPVAAAPLRRKIYQVYCRVLGARMQAAGVEVIGVPPAAVEDGYLARPYWREATHANQAYGHLLLQMLGIL